MAFAATQIPSQGQSEAANSGSTPAQPGALGTQRQRLAIPPQVKRAASSTNIGQVSHTPHASSATPARTPAGPAVVAPRTPPPSAPSARRNIGPAGAIDRRYQPSTTNPRADIARPTVQQQEGRNLLHRSSHNAALVERGSSQATLHGNATPTTGVTPSQPSLGNCILMTPTNQYPGCRPWLTLALVLGTPLLSPGHEPVQPHLCRHSIRPSWSLTMLRYRQFHALTEMALRDPSADRDLRVLLVS